MKMYRLLGKLGMVSLCAPLLLACGDNRSDLVLESGNRDLDQVAPAGPTEVGKSKTETFTFRNIQDHGVLVKQISGIAAPFYRLAGSTCKEGELVPAHDACTVVVTYVPAEAARSECLGPMRSCRSSPATSWGSPALAKQADRSRGDPVGS